MRPHTLLLLLLSLVLLVPLVAALGLWSIDSSYVRRLIVTRVEQATGRSFTIDGPVEVSWGLHPTFTLSRIALANIPAAAEPAMITVERLALQVDALSLLSGRPDLERLSLSGLDMLLEPGPDGTGNWMFPTEPAAAGAGAADTDALPIVRQLLIADARVRYCAVGGSTTELNLVRAALDASPAGASATFGLTGSLDGRPLRSSGRLGSLDTLTGADAMPVTVTDFTLALGDSALAGSASLRVAGERPRVEADLVADKLDLRDVGGRGDAPAPPIDNGKLFSTSPLPFEVLNLLDLQVHLRAERVQTAAVELGQLELVVTLEGGLLQVRPLGFRLRDRPVTGELVVDAAVEPAGVELSLGGDDLDIGRLLASLAHGAAVEGRGDIRLQIAGRGQTPHALAATTTGSVNVLMGAGALPTELLGQLTGGVRQLLADATARGSIEAASLHCAALDARAETGLVRLELLADGAYSTIVGGGTIDLGRELVDLTLTPQARQLDLNVAVPITVQGPLAAPDVGLDERDVPRRVASLLGAIFFPPAVLGAFIDLGSGRNNACLDLAAHPERLAAPAAADPDAGIVERIEGAGRQLLDEVQPSP